MAGVSAAVIAAPERRRTVWWRLVVPGLVLAGGVATAWALGVGPMLGLEHLARLERWIEDLGPLGPVVFIAGYAVAELLFVPALPLTILGGIVFGPVLGTAYVSVGATVGAALAFLAARYAMRGAVARWAARHPRLARIDRAVTEHGWRVLVVTRLVPLFPFNLQNFAYGLTGMKFWPFVGISWLCMLPGTAAYALTGSAIAEGGRSPRRMLGYVAAAGVLLVLVSLLPRWLSRQGGVAGELTAPDAGANAPRDRV